MANIYELYGRMVEAYDSECEGHRSTVNVLRRLKNGEIDLGALSVSDDNKWTITNHVTIEAEADTTPAN